MQKCENNTTAPDDAMEVQSSKTKSKKFLTFQCGQQMFGVDITEVRQIMQISPERCEDFVSDGVSISV